MIKTVEIFDEDELLGKLEDVLEKIADRDIYTVQQAMDICALFIDDNKDAVDLYYEQLSDEAEAEGEKEEEEVIYRKGTTGQKV